MDATALRERFAGCRYDPARASGHYESYFLRANHPTRPAAFWIRYTLFSPRGRPEATQGELWAIVWDEGGRRTAVKEARPLSECAFGRRLMSVLVGASRLDEREAAGEASSSGHAVAWDLAFGGGEAPLLLLPEAYYDRGFPKAKMMVLAPNAVFRGKITVDGATVVVDDWVGSVNHNWGARHTDQYAWGQVAGFDGAPGTFLEVGTGRVKVGPLWTPWITSLVFTDGGESFSLRGIPRGVRARARYTLFDWTFEGKDRGAVLRGRISAPRDAFVALTYPNPPGGAKICLNSKIARAEVTIARPGAAERRLVSEGRAAFEILTDREDHGVPLAV